MPWQKANPKLIEQLEKVAVDYPCDRRFMFGSPTFFVNGNMFAGVHQDDRHPPPFRRAGRKALFSEYPEAAPFTPMPGRPMKEYAAIPESLVKNTKVFDKLVKSSYEYASSIPFKEPGQKKK